MIKEIITIITFLLAANTLVFCADEITLSNGMKIKGNIVFNEKQNGGITIRTDNGIEMSFESSEIKEIRRNSGGSSVSRQDNLKNKSDSVADNKINIADGIASGVGLTQTSDEIVKKDGEVVQGKIEEVKKNEYIRMRVGEKLFHYKWADIDSYKKSENNSKPEISLDNGVQLSLKSGEKVSGSLVKNNIANDWIVFKPRFGNATTVIKRESIISVSGSDKLLDYGKKGFLSLNNGDKFTCAIISNELQNNIITVELSIAKTRLKIERNSIMSFASDDAIKFPSQLTNSGSVSVPTIIPSKKQFFSDETSYVSSNVETRREPAASAEKYNYNNYNNSLNLRSYVSSQDAGSGFGNVLELQTLSFSSILLQYTTKTSDSNAFMLGFGYAGAGYAQYSLTEISLDLAVDFFFTPTSPKGFYIAPAFEVLFSSASLPGMQSYSQTWFCLGGLLGYRFISEQAFVLDLFLSDGIWFGTQTKYMNISGYLAFGVGVGVAF